MPPSMPLIAIAGGPPDPTKHAADNDECLPFFSVTVVFDVKIQNRRPAGAPPRAPDHLFFIRDDEGGGP